MEQLNESDLKEWAQAYVERYKNDILMREKAIPQIPEDLHKKVQNITTAMKQAHINGEKQYTFRGLKGEGITLNLEPLFASKGHDDEISANLRYVNQPKTDQIDDLTLQTYISRLFLYSKGG